MSIYSALVALFLAFAVVQGIPANVKSSVTVNELIRMRCSHNPDYETSFFFNGTVTAYLGQDTGPSFSPASSIKTLFNAVGWNVAKCYKGATGVWYLVGREAMWYIDPKTDSIMNTWTNLNNELVNVAHVDNDPVMQTFAPGQPPSFPVQVYGDQTILPSDVTTALNYVNAMQNPPNATFDAYAPQKFYQAAELFKFISPTDEVFSNLDQVDSTIVTWTRTSQFLPWMKMGNKAGYLLYSFQGAKIPDWTYLPEQIKADIENRVPHYKHAPQSKCYPNLAGTFHGNSGVTSWTFFKENFEAYLAGAQFPLPTARTYGCRTEAQYVPAPDTQCKAEAVLVSSGSWQSGGQPVNQYNLIINNTGVKKVQTAAVTLNFAGQVLGSWGIQATATPNVYDVNLYGNGIAAGQTASGYGIQVTGTPSVSVAVTCN